MAPPVASPEPTAGRIQWPKTWGHRGCVACRFCRDSSSSSIGHDPPCIWPSRASLRRVLLDGVPARASADTSCCAFLPCPLCLQCLCRVPLVSPRLPFGSCTHRNAPLTPSGPLFDRFPAENTLASFKAAIREGAHGLESDVHLTKDGRLILFHGTSALLRLLPDLVSVLFVQQADVVSPPCRRADARLDRTTDGTGLIGEQNWAGQIEHLRTTALPIQPIPLFEDVIDLLMQVSPAALGRTHLPPD